MPRVGAAAEILVNPKNPEQTYIEQDKAIKIRNAIVSAFCASLGLCVLLLVLVPARYAGVMACVTAILMFSAIPAAILANIFYGRRR